METDETRNPNRPPPAPQDGTGTPIGPHHPNTPIILPFVESICTLATQLGESCDGNSRKLSAEDREVLDAIQRDYAAGVLRLLGEAYLRAAAIFQRKDE